MTPEQWQKAEALFQAALARPSAERSAFLQEVCGQDTELRTEVESLLASHDEAEDFLVEPVLVQAEAVERSEPVESLVGRRIGSYRVLEEIGQGGMGAVYLAVRADDQYRKRVAIKLLKPGMDTRAIVRRFRNERQILAGLDHPNIAKLLDGGTTEDGRPYFVMDYIEGQPIDEYCDTHQLSIDERLALFRTVCSAVHYAHQNLVVHRDLKPGNILVTAEGVPKLLDFGIAKLLNPELAAQALETTTAVRPMTPEYASPEQVRSETITTASDVYSLGVLLYELLTGYSPYRFQSHTPQEIERVICEQEPARPSTMVSRREAVDGHGLNRNAPTPEQISQARGSPPEKLRRRLRGDLDTIVLMALRKEPKRRYTSVQEFSEDLRRHLEGRPVMARKDTLAYRSGKFVRRNKAGVIAATLVLVSLLVGLIATTWQAHRVNQQRLRAEKQEMGNRRLLYAAQMNLAYQAWDNANVGLVRELLEAQRPRPGQEDLRGFEWHYLWRLCHRERLTWLHPDQVYSITFSPDGRTLASGGQDGYVRLWDLATQTEVAALPGHASTLPPSTYLPDGRVAPLPGHGPAVYPVAFSSDGQTLAAGHEDGVVVLWDVPRRQRRAILPGGHNQIVALGFSPDGKTLIAIDYKGIATRWNLTTQPARAPFTDDLPQGAWIAVSPDAQTLVWLNSRNAIDEAVRSYPAENAQTLVRLHSKNAVELWSVATGKKLVTLKGHEHTIHPITGFSSAGFSSDSKILAAASFDGVIKWWDLATRQEQATLKESDLKGAVFSPDGKMLATVSGYSTVRLRDLATRQERTTFTGHTNEITGVVFSLDNKLLVSSSKDHTVKLWDVATRAEQPITLKGHTQGVTAVAFSPDGRTLATGSMDTTAKLWDLETRQERQTLSGHTASVRVAFSPDGQTLVTASRDGTAKVWDLSTNKALRTLTPRRGPLYRVRFSPDGKLVAAAGHDGTVVVWDATTWQEWPPLRGHTDRIWAVHFSPDGKLLASGSWDGRVRLWGVATQREWHTLPSTGSLVFSLMFSPNSRLLAIGYHDGIVRLWDVITRQDYATLKGHLGYVSFVTFSPDGKRLVTGGKDPTLKMWDLVTKQVVAMLKGHQGPVPDAAFSPDGRILATASEDGTIKLWYGAMDKGL